MFSLGFLLGKDRKWPETSIILFHQKGTDKPSAQEKAGGT